jgi:hypothetical protein
MLNILDYSHIGYFEFQSKLFLWFILFNSINIYQYLVFDEKNNVMSNPNKKKKWKNITTI